MSKLFKDVSKMIINLKIIEQYNNFRQLGAEEDIIYLKDKVNNLYNIKDTQKLIEEFNWCVKMISLYYDDIDLEFKKYILKEERSVSEVSEE